MEMKVLKASGIVEDFDIEKFKRSLLRSGADHNLVKGVLKKVVDELTPYTTTKEIYRSAKKYLKLLNHASGLRYTLKRSLFRLGPSGYPFEKYIGELLKHYGYKVQVGIILDGQCVKHEVDVFASNETEISAIECKYHNTSGKATDVKVAMYVRSRFQDLQPAIAKKYSNKRFAGWIVTNTRCTSEAIRYAECSGLRIMSWKYPKEKSLENLIEQEKLYPVTVISGIRAGLVDKLIQNNIILLKDLLSMNVQDIKTLLSLDNRKASTLKKQAEQLCLCED